MLSYSVPVNLVVKAESLKEAQAIVAGKLSTWFCEDMSSFVDGFGYPHGSLLFWGYTQKDENNA